MRSDLALCGFAAYAARAASAWATAVARRRAAETVAREPDTPPLN